jgi:hypothetical protein
VLRAAEERKGDDQHLGERVPRVLGPGIANAFESGEEELNRTLRIDGESSRVHNQRHASARSDQCCPLGQAGRTRQTIESKTNFMSATEGIADGIQIACARIGCILPGDTSRPLSESSVHMATMSFSIPDEVRERFEEAFRGHDQSTVVTGLLLLAVEAEERRLRSLSLVERLRHLGDGSARPTLDLLRRAVPPRD